MSDSLLPPPTPPAIDGCHVHVIRCHSFPVAGWVGVTAHDYDLAGGDVAEYSRASPIFIHDISFCWCDAFSISRENHLEQTQMRELFANFPGNVKTKIQKNTKQKYQKKHQNWKPHN